MGHSDTVKVDPSKWTSLGLSAARIGGGYIYGRGVIDDKSDLFAAMMTTILLKRMGTKLDRDVIFVDRSGRRRRQRFWHPVSDQPTTGTTSTRKSVWRRRAMSSGATASRFTRPLKHTEKVGRGAQFVVHGPSGHGSRPMRDSAIASVWRQPSITSSCGIRRCA